MVTFANWLRPPFVIRMPSTAVGFVPAQLARTWVVVPVGRSHAGDLVLCARDPTPILVAALEHALGRRVKLAVAPAIHVEKLVRSIYGAPGSEDAPLPNAPPALADIGATEVLERKEATGRSRTMSRMLKLDESGPMRVPLRTLSPLDITLQEVDQAFSVVAVERMVMSYATQRWQAAILLTIDGIVAIGQRGHGEHLGPAEAIQLPLSVPSLVSVAVQTRQPTSDAPSSAVQRHLRSLLGDPSNAIAVPIEARGHIKAVLVVGDPVEGTPRDGLRDLARLTDALGAAYERFGRPTP